MIINLTQHKATVEQIEQGVIDLPELYRKDLISFLTFNDIPSKEEIEYRVYSIFNLVVDFCINLDSPIGEKVRTMVTDEEIFIEESEFKNLDISFMLGGAPFLMSSLEKELKHFGRCLYAFSKREAKEVESEGVVVKKAIFKHIGFVEV